MTDEQIEIDGDQALIKMSGGHIAVIDIADMHLVSGVRWSPRIHYRSDGTVRSIYAQGAMCINGVREVVLMHRLIDNTPSGFQTDHIDSNGLNNKRSNLRRATNSENQRNCRIRTDNKSGAKGVAWHKQTSKWQSSIKHEGRQHHLGLFKTVESASSAYAEASKQMHGDFGRTK